MHRLCVRVARRDLQTQLNRAFHELLRGDLWSSSVTSGKGLWAVRWLGEVEWRTNVGSTTARLATGDRRKLELPNEKMLTETRHVTSLCPVSVCCSSSTSRTADKYVVLNRTFGFLAANFMSAATHVKTPYSLTPIPLALLLLSFTSATYQTKSHSMSASGRAGGACKKEPKEDAQVAHAYLAYIRSPSFFSGL